MPDNRRYRPSSITVSNLHKGNSHLDWIQAKTTDKSLTYILSHHDRRNCMNISIKHLHKISRPFRDGLYI